MAGDFVLEVCVDSLHGALEAQQGGAGRLELCGNLEVGGVTASYGLMKLVKRHIHIPVHALIRPRGGDFVYSELEIEVMKADIGVVGELGFQGVAIGALTPDREVDVGAMRVLLRECGRFSLDVTFHRAFDCVVAPLEALEVIAGLGGVSRVLTSGQEASAVEGVALLRGLVERRSVGVLPGAGVSDVNARFLVEELLVSELHGSVRKELRASPLQDLLPGDKSSVIWTVDAEKVQRIVEVCKGTLLECEKGSDEA